MAEWDNLTGKYCLDDMGIPYEEPDLLKWGAWMEKADRHVAKSYVGPFYISTVFLGIDHSFDRPVEPILFETMVFDNGDGSALKSWKDSTSLDIQERYATRSDAILGHKLIVKQIEEWIAKSDKLLKGSTDIKQK